MNTSFTQITIKNPCREDWNLMSPAEKGRYCSSCKKVVHNFADLSHQQIIDILKASSSICAKFNDGQLDALNSYISKPAANSNWWTRSAVAIVLLAGLAVNKGSYAKPKVNQTVIVDQHRDRAAHDTIAQRIELSGVVKDESGNTLPGATVKYGLQTVVADVNGHFAISGQFNDDKITVAMVGFYTKTLNVRPGKQYSEITLQLSTTVLGELGFVSYKKVPFMKRQLIKIKNLFRSHH
ncbi:carboxypeptidase-like regulatory domain-containing protein [Mucilaginibacter sp. RS28]|uniref:Carboxypeptidase-like regulatory domain-containing protein n=1 Tax=Mucilaginibacter straminoryzae TaxID=2932774 RepID=A0A9X2BBI3_9SPHI|nr:carboxypeptidase-like regulatory domain-containing protein [Mucilaginibacter straminoryzae]MCJ8209882.1 carboxypeptidase-like regulatory domain-containing protein [Mucilaginibacter straminoryzae]